MIQRLPVGLALFSVKEELAQDYTATLRWVRNLGYQTVQFSGDDKTPMFGDLEPSQLKELLVELDLVPVTASVPLPDLEDKFEYWINTAKILSMPHLTLPVLPKELRQDRESFRSAARRLTELGYRYHDRGVQLAFHNHGFELEDLGGTTGMEILLEESDPEALSLLVDLGYVQLSGIDPVSFLRTHPERVCSVHLRDVARDGQHKFSPLGEGRLAVSDILTACADCQIRWPLVEIGLNRTSKSDATEISARYLARLGFVQPIEG
jgi:sugar phosphate isomerase/epimerase